MLVKGRLGRLCKICNVRFIPKTKGERVCPKCFNKQNNWRERLKKNGIKG